MMKRILCLLLAAVLLLGLCACGGQGGKTGTSDEEILAARRDKVVAQMQKTATFLWRAQEDITYSIRYDDMLIDEALKVSPKKTISIKAGQVYQGLPYSHAAGNLTTFQAFASEPDEKGVSTVSGLTWEYLNGTSAYMSRISTDCSGAVYMALSTVAATPEMVGTQYMTEGHGYLKVGEYETADPNENIDTNKDCEDNGPRVMLDAYAQLQKADAIVRRRNGVGHVMLITSVNVVLTEEGKVSGRDSTVTVTHQTNGKLQDNAYYYNEELGENVYYCFGVDDEYTFAELYADGYLPITCKELIDASAPEVDTTVIDSETEFTKDTICKGTLTSQLLITAVNVTITDANGAVVQEATCFARRGERLVFKLERIATDMPEIMIGKIDPDALAAGNYHCTMTCVQANDTVTTVRDFDFTV